jgi:transposase
LLKLLYWQHNGFCLWQKRLEKERFRWPQADCDLLEVTQRELNWLLDGLSLEQRQAHKQLAYSTLT